MSNLLLKAHEKYLREEVAKHTHALTITLRSDNQQEALVNRRMRLVETVRHLLQRINRKLFNHRHKREQYCVGTVTVIESGRKLNRLHAHLSLACPTHISYEKFEVIVASAVCKCRSLGSEYELKPTIDSAGWGSYLAKDGTEAFAPECTQRAKH